MSVSDNDFLFLCDAPKEVLVGSVLRLWEELERMKSPITVESPNLPEEPEVGQYVVKDSAGIVRMCGDEDKFNLSQVEALAILLSLDEYISIQFYFCGSADLLSEWSNGRKVVRNAK
jgi:hypothetical protein